MKNELELTVRLDKSLQEIQKILKEKGFDFKEECILEDLYMRKNKRYQSVEELLNECILIRKVNHHLNFVLKKKEYLENGDLKKDQKLSLTIDNFENGKKFLEQIEYQTFFTLKQHMYIYQKEKLEFLVQVVDDLGIFLEYEARHGESIPEMKNILESIWCQTFSNYYEKKAIQYIEKHHLF